MNSKPVSLLIVATIISSAVLSYGQILCVGEFGYVHVEVVGDSSCDTNARSPDATVFSDTRIEQVDCGNCSDIALTELYPGIRQTPDTNPGYLLAVIHKAITFVCADVEDSEIENHRHLISDVRPPKVQDILATAIIIC